MSNINSSQTQNPESPAHSSSAKTIRSPKPLRPKLSKILEAQISAVVGSEAQYSEGMKNCNNNLSNLFSKFESYYSTVHDGNQIFRIVGIHHLGSIINKPDVMKEHCNNFLKSSIQASVLTDVSDEYKKHCNKRKIVEILQSLLVELEKKKLEVEFYKNITPYLNTYKIFDFAIVAFYRLYTYMFGYLNNEFSDDLRFQESLILGYGKEADSNTINIVCQCFSLKVDIYEVSGSIVELTCYEAKQTKETKQKKFWRNLSNVQFSILKFNKNYALVEEKSQAREKLDQHLWQQNLTISEIDQKKNTLSQFYLTDQKSLWDMENDPISPVHTQVESVVRQRRDTPKIARVDEMSSSFLNTFGIKLDSHQKEKQLREEILQIKRLESISYIKPKQNSNLKISSVISQKVFPHKPFPEMKNQISEQDIDAISSRKNESLIYNKSVSRISSKAGTIKKQSVLGHSMRSVQPSGYHNTEERQVEILYTKLTQSERKQIVTQYLRNKICEYTENRYRSPQHFRQSSQLVHSKSLMISTNGLQIQITRN